MLNIPDLNFSNKVMSEEEIKELGATRSQAKMIDSLKEQEECLQFLAECNYKWSIAQASNFSKIYVVLQCNCLLLIAIAVGIWWDKF